MAAQRIKGQEVNILIVRGGVFEDSLTDIQNFNVELDLEIKKQGYLGEKTDRRDEVFNGVKYDMELHLHSQAFMNFVSAVLDRAKRINPDLVFNITGVLNFPDGTTPTFLIPDVKFGAIPMNVPSRGEYVKIKLQGEADDLKLNPST